MNEIEMIEKYTAGFDYEVDNGSKLDLSQLPIEVAIADIDQYPNEKYALLRKEGLGTSDSSIVLEVNPFKTRSELIEEKCRDYLTQEELDVGDKAAVRKGRDLEPMIIHKMTQILGKKVLKPLDMYQHKDFEWIRFNFDGVIDKVYNDDGTYQYIPAEIKVVTTFGEKHYNKKLAFFTEGGFLNGIPENHSETNNSIVTKSELYGIPPYYYTQLQQQIFGLDAPYGYLGVLFEKDWTIRVYFVWRDQNMLNDLVIQSNQIWNQVLKQRPMNFDISGATTTSSETSENLDGIEPE